MIRAKKNMNLEQRFDNQIWQSEIFKPHFKNSEANMQDIRRKIVPIAGDLIVDKLGLSQADRAMVTAETNIIINCAASVSFTDPLLDAIEINYKGCGRMLALAKEC